VDDPGSEQGGPPAAGWDRRRVVAAAVGGVVVLGVIALLVVGLVNRDSVGTSIQDALAAGERPEAPALTLPVLVAADGIGPEGAEVSLADLRGRTVVLNFWASWCTPCEIEAPVLEAVAARYRDDGDVVVLGVDVQDLREKALEFVRETGVTYPTLRDGGDDAMNAYQVPALPETFVIDPEGRVALKIRGIIQEEAQLTTAIDQVRRGAA
jgi:cytochrome c biogenesis protein CcmG, thiol:disulfide interchange protein DsbE